MENCTPNNGLTNEDLLIVNGIVVPKIKVEVRFLTYSEDIESASKGRWFNINGKEVDINGDEI